MCFKEKCTIDSKRISDFQFTNTLSFFYTCYNVSKWNPGMKHWHTNINVIENKNITVTSNRRITWICNRLLYYFVFLAHGHVMIWEKQFIARVWDDTFPVLCLICNMKFCRSIIPLFNYELCTTLCLLEVTWSTPFMLIFVINHTCVLPYMSVLWCTINREVINTSFRFDLK